MKKIESVTQMGMDCHRKFSTVTGRDAEGRIVWRERVEHADRSRLREALQAWPAGTPVLLEATFGWGWMCDELSAARLRPHLASSGKLAAWRKARGLAKSNRLDADLISELPMRSGERWWEVWLAPAEVREQREWMRHRMALVGMQTAIKNRMHAVLHRHGLVNPHADLFGVAGRRLLTELIAPSDPRLPASGKAVLRDDLRILDHVRRIIAQVTREQRRQIRRHPAGEHLRSLPGVATILAYTIAAEIGRIERFASARRLASYSLLAPLAHDSGDEHGDQTPLGRHVGHIGRRTLKWAWIEAAHGAVHSGGRFRALFDRRTDNGTRNRQRGYIAVAHELCRVAYAMWKHGEDYRDSPPQRPGARTQAATASSVKDQPAWSTPVVCPGRGQPDLPMVAVAKAPQAS